MRTKPRSLNNSVGEIDFSNPLNVTSTSSDPEDSTRVQEFDPIFKAPLTIDIGHHEIHEGDAFLCGHADVTMSNADTIIIAFKTIAGTKRMHLLYTFNTLVGCHFDIYKDSTWDASSGTLLPVYNHLQTDAPDDSTVLEDQSTGSFIPSNNMILDPTTHVAGDKVIPSDYIFGNNQKTGGGSRAVAEIILEPDTQHSFVFTADGNSNSGQVKLNWYEHTDS